MSPRAQQVVWPALLACVLLGLWQGLVVMLDVPAYLVPSPLRVAQVLVSDSAMLFAALAVTLKITLLAFACATVLGVGHSALAIGSAVR